MKIWFLTTEFPPAFGGGIGMYTDIASRMMSQQGHDVTVFVSDAEEKEERVTEYLQYIRFLPQNYEIYSYMGHWPAVAYIMWLKIKEQIQKQGPPDVIEAQEYNATAYYLLQYKHMGEELLANTKVVVHCHTPTFELNKINHRPEYQFPEYWIGRMEQFCLRSADGVLSPSQFLKDQLTQQFGWLPPEKVQVIPLPFPEMTQSWDADRHQDAILYSGRLEYRKGILQFLQCMEQLWQEGVPTKLITYGGDTFFAPRNKMLGDIIREKYRHRIQEGLLEIHASIPPQELEGHICKARIAVVPSLYENFPLTSVTALSLGVPVLVSRQGGQAEMVEESGKNGLIFDWDIPGDCLEKLRQILAMPKGDLAQMAENGRARIRTLTSFTENLARRMEYFTQILQQEEGGRLYPFNCAMNPSPIPAGMPTGQKDKLSVVVPFYNLGSTIDATVNSILASTYPDMEIVIVNDGSTDGASLEKLEQIQKAHPEIVVLHGPNQGLALARNTGAQAAKGEYVVFLDADDAVEPGFYARAVQLLKRHSNVGFVYSWVRYFEGSKDLWPTFSTEFPYFALSNMLAAFAVLRRDVFLAFGQNRPDMEYGMEDYDAWLSIAEKGYGGLCIPEPLNLYRVRKNSMARQFNDASKLYLIKNLSKHHGEIYRRYGEEIYNLLQSNGASIYWNNPTWELHPSGLINADMLNAANQKAADLQLQMDQLYQSKWFRLKSAIDRILYRNHS